MNLKRKTTLPRFIEVLLTSIEVQFDQWVIPIGYMPLYMEAIASIYVNIYIGWFDYDVINDETPTFLYMRLTKSQHFGRN